MLEYFLSRAIFDPSKVVLDPSKRQDHDGSTQHTDPTFSDDQLIDTNGPLFTRNLLTEPSVIQFLSDRVKQAAWFKRHLLAVIELSKSDAQTSKAAANAITILVRAGVRFNGVDFRGIRIPGADLSCGQFDSAQLEDTDLTGVNFSKSWIRQADLSRACMDGTRFGELPYLKEPGGFFTCAFSPDGKHLAASLYNGDICVYDTATWTRIQVFQGHQDRVTSLAYSPNSQQLLSGSDDKTARLWNNETGSNDLILEGHSEKVGAVAFSPTGQQVATASGGNNSVRLWDVRTGAFVFVLVDDIGMVSSITYSPDGNRIACTNVDVAAIRIFDTLTGLLVLESRKGREGLECLAYSHNGQRIATGSHHGRLQLWEVTATSLEPGRTWMACTYFITSVAFSPDDRWIASSSFNHAVKLWDSYPGLPVSLIISHVDIVNSVRFSPNGSYIASTGDDNTLRLCEVNSLGSGLGSHDALDPQYCATYSPDGRQLITGSQQSPMRQFNADSGDVDFVFPDHLYSINCIAFSPDDHQLAIGGEEGVTLWSVKSCAVSFVLSGHESRVCSVAFSPCGRWLTSGSRDRTVRLWDTRSGAAGHVLTGHKGEVQNVAFSPDGRWIASVCEEGIVLLWESGTGELKAEKTIDISPYTQNVVAYKPDCLQVASSHGDGNIRMWDVDQQLQGFRYILKQDQRSYQFAFSSCGQWVATTHDTCVRLWRLPSSDHDLQALPLQDQDCVSVIEGFTSSIENVVWRPNKLEPATSGWDGSIRAWRVVEDTIGSRKVAVQLLWSSGPALLYASGAILHSAVGLSTINRKLLQQHGAITNSD